MGASSHPCAVALYIQLSASIAGHRGEHGSMTLAEFTATTSDGLFLTGLDLNLGRCPTFAPRFELMRFRQVMPRTSCIIKYNVKYFKVI